MSQRDERIAEIRRLSLLLPDYEFNFETGDGKRIRLSAERGFVPARRAACPDCLQGSRRRRGIAYGCPTCGGRDLALGTPTSRELERQGLRIRGRGWIEVDPYDRQAQAVGSERTEVVSRVRWVPCDACGGKGAFGNQRRCTRCGDSGKPGFVRAPSERIRYVDESVRVEVEVPAGEGDQLLAALEEGFHGLGRATEQRRLAGSFEELLAALESMYAAWPALARLYSSVYVVRDLRATDLEPGLQRLLAGALAFIEARMPDPIRVPAHARALERQGPGGSRSKASAGIAA